ncbi:Protein N-acetyltransferase, RimJ/RimL family [Actinacidiphila alni]|uniref:Protein N-acetyltransferase, RimJ/RimL family n=1 Tax=Actinacidiphila alni TaxID=380248 RepID=A0A1I2F0F6_9ACTN|nr:GNAT family N-acetyltransferase [Actinacidiphila alni]SFE98635.1 Protein N-acetyltransferase, RimJ/RimL family [Actinacidiphila alni]
MSTPHTRVRPATPEDLSALSDIHARARASYYAGHIPAEEYSGPAELERQREATARAIASDEHTVLCAVRDDHVVGFAVLAARHDEDKLFHFHIDPSVWRTGAGTALHHACVDVWRTAGLTRARLEVFAPNARARAFYADQGWQEDGRVDDHVRMVLRVPTDIRSPQRVGE